MDRRQIEHFLAVVNEGSVSGAARRLLLTQPAVSQTIRELEADLGTELFRRGRGMMLTPAGSALVGPAQALLRGFDGARAAVEQVAGLLTGSVHVAVPGALVGDPLISLVVRYRSRFPGVRVTIDDAPPGPEAMGLLSRGSIELLVSDALPMTEDPGQDHVVLGEEGYMAVFPPDTNVPDRPLGLVDLAGRDMVAGRSPGPAIRPRWLAQFGEAGLATPQVTVETSDRRALAALVRAGVAMTLLPDSEARDAAALGAVVRPLEDDLRRTIRLHFRSPDLTPAAVALVDLARAS